MGFSVIMRVAVRCILFFVATNFLTFEGEAGYKDNPTASGFQWGTQKI
jgi:hypothetical protein